METILKYFTDLSEKQQQQFAALPDIYSNWNNQINVISRKDIEHLIATTCIAFTWNSKNHLIHQRN